MACWAGGARTSCSPVFRQASGSSSPVTGQCSCLSCVETRRQVGLEEGGGC
jgi:hypothetical protein